jgi:hypothetical protein
MLQVLSTFLDSVAVGFFYYLKILVDMQRHNYQKTFHFEDSVLAATKYRSYFCERKSSPVNTRNRTLRCIGTCLFSRYFMPHARRIDSFMKSCNDFSLTKVKAKKVVPLYKLRNIQPRSNSCT